MSQTRFYDAHNVIVTAISEDVLMMRDFDDHDPLGIAFYVYGLLAACRRGNRVYLSIGQTQHDY